ncbi:MAG: ABC transporter ATP-binding protein [Chromatiales bacterium]|nr:ABC transporter ATP-binding protein [Chromatiales bacterium]
MSDQVDAVVELEGVGFAWPGQAPVLDIDSLIVPPGGRLFISGPSGCGKSTLLGLIGGVLTADRGRVSVLGTDLGTLGVWRRDAFRADHIGFIFQMFNLLPYLSVVENAVLPCRFSGRRRSRAEAASGTVRGEAVRLLERLGLGADGLLERPVTELSIGQQQRVAAARALIGSPDLVIADEPTSALDSDSRNDFLALLTSECAAAGSTIIFVSHDRSLAAQFDQSIALETLNRAGRKAA